MLAYSHDLGGSLLSSSPRTVISLFLLVVDDVDNARGWHTAHGEQTKAARRRTTGRPWTGTDSSHGRCGSVVAGGGEYEGNNMQVKHTNGTKSPRINCSSNF